MKVIIFKEMPKHEFSDSAKTNEKTSCFKPSFLRMTYKFTRRVGLRLKAILQGMIRKDYFEFNTAL